MFTCSVDYSIYADELCAVIAVVAVVVTVHSAHRMNRKNVCLKRRSVCSSLSWYYVSVFFFFCCSHLSFYVLFCFVPYCQCCRCCFHPLLVFGFPYIMITFTSFFSYAFFLCICCAHTEPASSNFVLCDLMQAAQTH